MSEAAAEALAGGASDGGQGGDGGAQTPQMPEWMAGLSDDLRADPDLNRYKSVEDLAKGMKETRAWARGRVAIPSGEDDVGWQEFAQRMRPEKPEDYSIPVTGEDTAMADAFRAFAHDKGFHPRYAQAAAEFFNQYSSDQMSRLQQQGRDGVKAIELELGATAYNQRIEATNAMLKAVGMGDDFDVVRGLESAVGAEKTMRALFALAEKTGELGKVDSTDVAMRMGALSPESAQTEIDRISNDPDLRKEAFKAGSPTNLRVKELNKIAAQRKG